jgi:cytochrome c oxidase subunit II
VRFVKNRAFAALASFASLLLAGAAHAAQPYPWQMDLQPAGSGVMKEIRWFEDYTLWFIVPVTLLVLVLLVIVVVRFREKANPVASKTSHNTLIEIIWTLGPVIVLFLIAIPSFQLLTNELTIPKDADMTVKATGNQWYWSYEYQGEKEVSFDSLLLKDEDRAGLGKQDKAEYPHLLAVDNELVVPVGKTVRVLVTGADVIHAFAMPAFGVKIDAVPGRMNETWFKADAVGMYYGQCSELCGKDHAFMPIAIRVVSDDQFKTWLSAAATNVGAANKALVATVDGKKSVDVAENVK